VIVITVILIALLVSRSKRQKLVINKGSTETSVTNPMMHIDVLYDSIPNNRQPSVVSTTRAHGTGDDTAIPTIIITKETLPNEASLSVPRITSSVSDYEVPIQTLTRAPPSTDYSPGSIYLQLENLEESDVLRGSSRSIYDELSQLPDDDKSTLRRDQVTTSIYDNSFDVDEKETLRRQLEDNYGNMDDDENGSNNGDTLKRNKVYVEDEYDCIDVLDDLSLPPPINLDESSTAMGLTSEESAALQQDNGTPNAFYFSLEDPNEHQNEQKIETIEPVAEPVTQQKRTLKSTEKRKTKVFIQPAENEEEIYGQMETSSVTLISPKTLKFEGAIGSGQFGNVFKALWSKGGDRTIEVAVKTLQKNATEQEKIKFLQEAAIMAQFKHSNVIKLFGIISHKESPMIVIEYMPKGDLFGVLQKLRPDPGQLAHPDIRFNLLSFCRQVCLGMVYLSGKGFVHRDLAARNILVSADNICKIIDFGLSRDLEDENYYVSHKGAMIPVKWTAPEALNYRKYSTASDVWSYGCLMYEIWSVGHKPFEKFSNIDTLERICGGYRLPPPPGCSIAIYKLMMDCWHPIGDDRPSFNDIMLVLLQQDKDIFFMPEDALSTHPKSGTLGASLDAGELMYSDIQKTYEEEMDHTMNCCHTVN
jgi:serine/threonine-protein kinase RIO1